MPMLLTYTRPVNLRNLLIRSNNCVSKGLRSQILLADFGKSAVGTDKSAAASALCPQLCFQVRVIISSFGFIIDYVL